VAAASLVSALSLGISSEPSVVVVEDPPGVIFSASAAGQMKASDPFFKLDGPFWTPTQADILQLEKRFPAFLRSSKASACKLLPWNNYKHIRQYFGFSRNQMKLIYINGFCDDFSTEWKEHLVFALDGGDCFYQAVYDPTAGGFLECYVNGVS
jgi:hypothetical protein